VTKRRGRIIAEEMREGSPFFTVSATLPVIESFGFAEEIRKRTSGAALPQLIFAGYEILDQDPFWVPQTEEELEDFGETVERKNVAKKYVDAIRTRKVTFQGYDLISRDCLLRGRFSEERKSRRR
jgi:ribosome assembly protein 1